MLEAFQNRFTSTMKNRQPSTYPGGLPPIQACSLGSDVTGTVSYLEEEGGFFWLQRDPERVDEIGALLEREAEQLADGRLAAGVVVVAQWQEAFYRAVVLETTGEEDVLLHFVDWGNRDWVPRLKLRLAKHAEVQEPPLAIRWIFFDTQQSAFHCPHSGVDWKGFATRGGRRTWRTRTIQ